MKILINIVSNNFYFHHLEAFLYHVSDLKIDLTLRVELVNVPKYKVTWLLNHDRNYDIQVIETTLKFSNFEEEKGFCTNRRAYLLSDPVKNSKFDYVCYFDVNLIILPSLFDLITKNFDKDAFFYLDTCHSSFKKRFWKFKSSKRLGPLGTPHHMVMKAGVQIYKVGPITNAFLSDYLNTVKPLDRVWYVDQEALYIVLSKYIDKIDFYNFYTADEVAFNSFSEQAKIIYRKGPISPNLDDYISQIFYANASE